MTVHSRSYAFFLALIACVAAIACAPRSAGAQGIPSPSLVAKAPSPYVSAAGPKMIAAWNGAAQRAREKVTVGDLLHTPLAIANPKATDNNPVAVTSTVQTQDYTLTAEPSATYTATTNSSGVTTVTPPSDTPTNVDPVWSADEQTIYFASNRSSAATGNASASANTDGSEPSASGLFHLYAIGSDGSSTSAAQLTADTANERWPSVVGTSGIVYCATPAGGGPYGLYLASFNSGGTSINTAGASQLVVVDNSGVTLDCEHPSYSGGIVVFAGRQVSNAGVVGHYHIYAFDVASGQLTQLTSGNSDDENPSFSSVVGLIAFDSNATSFTNATTGTGSVANGTQGTRAIFVSSAAGTNIAQFSLASTTTNSIEPAWTTAAVSNDFVSNANDTYLFFSSNRSGTGHYSIYDFDAYPNGGAFTAETTSVSAVPVLTSDPTGAAQTGAADNFEPAPPQFRFYTTVLYVTPRTLINDDPDNPTTSTENPLGNATSFPDGAEDNEPAMAATNSPGMFSAVASGPSETVPTGGLEIFSSHLADIDPPTLLRYSGDEILHTVNSTGTQTRYVPAGTTVTFIARLSDRQSGVGNVFLQIKNPNSKYQDSAGLEHKVFTRDYEFYNPLANTHPHDNGNEATTIDLIEQSETGTGEILGGDVIGGYDGTNPIELGHMVTSQEYGAPAITGTTGTYPTTGISGQSEFAAAITNPIVTTLSLKDVENLTYSGPTDATPEVNQFNHLAGDVLQLYDYTGAPTEQVQVISATYNLTGTAPIGATLITTPIQDVYMIPTGVTANAPGYAQIVAISRMDNMGQEIDCQAIDANLAGVTGSNTSEYSTPIFTAGYDDAAPHSGNDERTATNGTPDGVWLKMTPVPADDPTYGSDHNGGVLYEATWTTPTTDPSDWYLDVIAYDNAEPTAQNWRIYDNIWGFTTKPFGANHGILLVNDYMLPQKFFSGRFGTIATVSSNGVVGISSNVPQNFFGAESYLTDIDTSYADAANNEGEDAWVPDTGFEDIDDGVIEVTGTMTQLFHRPAGAVTSTFGGNTYSPYYPNALGVNSYFDSEQDGPSTADTQPVFPLGNTNGSIAVGLGQLEYANAPQTVPSQQYDIYRLLCRGPLSTSVLNEYLPTVTAQKADILTGNPAKNVLTASRCVLWSSPFAGDEFADAGTITDPNTQTALSNYVTAGGRLMVEGIDVGFALTNSGNVTNTFYSNVLQAKFGADSVPPDDASLVLTGSAKFTDYVSEDAFINNEDGNYPEFGGPIGHNNFKLADTVDTEHIPNWTYLPPAAGRIGLALDDRNVDGSSDSRTDASLVDGPIQVVGVTPVGYIDSFSNLLSEPGATGPIVGPVEATELYGSGGSAPGGSTPNDQLAYTIFTSPSGVNYGAGEVVYSSFGLESISQETVPLTQTQSAFQSNNYEVFSVEAQRSDLMHNIICFLRTGSITGTVTNTGGGGQANAEVIAYPVSTAGYVNTNNAVSFTGTTDGSGNFTILGVPAGRYQLAAYSSGVSFQHTAGSTVDVHGGDVGVINLQVSPSAPGSLDVTVVNALDGSFIPGATVTVVEALTGAPNYSGTTNASGVAAFPTVATGSYNITVTKSGFSTGTTTASVTTANLTNVTVTLTAGPATVSGTVTNAATGAPIQGATITATNSSVAADVYTATSAADGTYTIAEIVPGTYTVKAVAMNYESQSVTGLVVASGASITQNFMLSAEQFATVSGLVQNADSEAAPGITVTLASTTSSYTQTATSSASTFTDPTTSTQADNAQFTNVPYDTYTVTATSSFGNVTTATFTVNSANTTFPTITLPAVHAYTSSVANELSMISAPYDYSSSGDTLAELFGYSNPKITTWEPLENAYATPGVSPADTLHLGIGYWVRFPATSVNLLIAGTPLASTTTTYSVPLYIGWNMIGEPFVNSAGEPVSDLTVTSNGNTYPFATAISNQYQLVGPTLYTYKAGDTAYETLTSSGTLNEYQGYWIHALSNCTLNFVKP